MALLAWENVIEATSTALVASSQVAGYEATMLRVPIGNPAVAWQTAAGVVDASLTITPASAASWRALCLARTNLTPSATIRVRVGTAANITSSPAYDSGVVSGGVTRGIGQALHVMPSEITAAVMRVDISDPTNPDGRLNIPLVFAGSGTETPVSITPRRGLDIRSADAITRGGVVIAQPLSRARTCEIKIGFLRDAQAAWLLDLEAAAGGKRNILFVPRTTYSRAAAETIFGLVTPTGSGFLDPRGAFLEWSAAITERL